MLSDLFYVKNKDTYPPFKKGLYLEEYFLAANSVEKLFPTQPEKYFYKQAKKYKRTYIPVLWTNFQIEGWFKNKKQIMQKQLDEWIAKNPNPNGYFTLVQYDDGPLLSLPENTIIYGACSGTVPMPLIYQDINETLDKIPKKTFSEKKILCSFVGSLTHTLRNQMANKYKNNKNFRICSNKGWTPKVNKTNQDNFINTTVDSKFALAPRGYGRSSFRFFEIFKLGTIPIYIWDDIEWLPYKDEIDYSKVCISINISQIDQLERILLDISKEKYEEMINEYNKIKHKFGLDFMCEYIEKKVQIE